MGYSGTSIAAAGPLPLARLRVKLEKQFTNAKNGEDAVIATKYRL
ncbi:hypothetical protein [Argonema antarcticum]|nr:hypothetical protein [Argonema antarcticum]